MPNLIKASTISPVSAFLDFKSPIVLNSDAIRWQTKISHQPGQF
jgi:hypothetical protein